jgi:hypothetical protein
LLPDTDLVPGGIPKRRYPKVTLGIGRSDNLAAMSTNLLKGFLHPLNEDIRPHTGLAGNGNICHEVPNDVPGAILEAWLILTLATNAPAENGSIEGC